MATHDYVIANGTGAAVRSDLNNALAAIVSNNSSSTEPGTRYAYQFWADTNENVLKIRNSSNDGWITLRELDGTMLIEDGSASTPGLAFADDANTGIFSPAADQIGFATGGAERLEIGSSEVVFNDPSNDVDFRVESNGETHMLFVDAGNDCIGIGNSSPSRKLHIHDGSGSSAQIVKIDSGGVGLLTIQSGTSSESRIEFGDSDNDDAGYIYYDNNGDVMKFGVNASERARIDSSGRLLVGISSASSAVGMIVGKSAGDSIGKIFVGKNDSTIGNGNGIGAIQFGGSADETQGAEIKGEADATWTHSSSHPSRLVFSTTANGASSPTERLRIDSSGRLMVGTTSPGPAAGEQLTIADSANAGITIRSGTSSAGTILFEDSAQDRGEIQYSHNGDYMRFKTAGSERFRIAGNGRITAQVIYGTPLSGTTRDVFIEDGGQLGYISSVRNSKVNINLLSNVDWLYQLQPSSFNYKLTDQEGAYTGEVNPELEYGLIAEDVEPVAPELCFYDEVEGEMELRGIHYKKLIVPMLKALQEAKAKITTLETKVAALEAG